MKPAKDHFPPLKEGGKGGFSGTGARKSPSIPLFQRGKVAFERLHCSRQGGRRRESGSTLVEFGIVLVLLISLTFGIVDGGRLIWDYSLLSNATSEGARYAAVRSPNAKFPATETDIKTQVTTMSVGLGIPANDVTVSVIDSSGTVHSGWNGTYAKQGATIKVAVQYTFTPITPLFPLGTFNLNSVSEMMIAR